jgi:hypothetical protein
MSQLYDLIGEFQNRFREYLVSKLDPRTIEDELQRSREVVGRKKLELASYKQLVLSNKSVFLEDFGKAHNLPTWLDDLLEIRNKVAHYDAVSTEDMDEAVRLIKKISDLAGLDTSYLKETSRFEKPQIKDAITLRPESLIYAPELDALIKEMPKLSSKPTKAEYRVFRYGIGRGSIWIGKQRKGYRIVTTGVTNALRSEIETVTNKKSSNIPGSRPPLVEGPVLESGQIGFDGLSESLIQIIISQPGRSESYAVSTLITDSGAC